jgi:hypothetical protein
MTEQVRFFDGKKFVWDGEEYESEPKASEIEQEYASAGFQVQSWREGGKVLLYTRRPVSEVVADEP